MKALKSITLAALVAAISGLAHADGVERYGRAAPSIGTGVTVPSVGTVDVASVQGRASIVRNAQPGNSELTITARSAADVLGRS
jgi:hypothetical protein